MAFVFYDTETTGTDTSFDQILQFAAIRTDDDLNELERFEIRCRLLPHMIPAPRALLTTGVTPALLTDRSLPSHYQAICQIADKLESWSPANFVGYNSMEFDERLLRQAFYQNLKPIYLTNAGRNRRVDILKLIDATIVFAPKSIVLPLSGNGRITRRLDTIAPANGFNHENAHDALADVEATIYMARLVRTRNPLLWDGLLATSAKDSAIGVLQSNATLALVESRYGRQTVIPVSWCGQNPMYAAQVGVFDLRNDPADFFGLTVEDLVATMRAPQSPFRIVQANSNPILFPLAQAAIGTIKECPSSAVVASRAQAIARNRTFQTKVGDAIAGRYPEKTPSQFVEKRIYDGFPTTGDVRMAEVFHKSPWDARRPILDKMTDERCRDLGLRLIGIEASEHLSPDDSARFNAWLRNRRVGPAPNQTFRTVDQAIAECTNDLECASANEKEQLREILSWLEAQSEMTPTAELRLSTVG